MKRVLKEIERKEIISNEIATYDDYCNSNCSLKQTLTIETYDSLVWNTENIKLFIELEQPETIKEFIEQKGITKKELVEWLNENYK